MVNPAIGKDHLPEFFHQIDFLIMAVFRVDDLGPAVKIAGVAGSFPRLDKQRVDRLVGKPEFFGDNLSDLVFLFGSGIPIHIKSAEQQRRCRQPQFSSWLSSG